MNVTTKIIADGRVHAMNCPAPSHPGDRDGKGLKYRWDGHTMPMLKCWSGECSYFEIFDSLGLSIPRPEPSDLSRFIVGRYQHEDRKEPDRLAYRRDWPADFEGFATCPFKKDGEVCGRTDRHKHPWSSRGLSIKGTKVLPWGEDKPENELVIGEGEKAAAFLMGMTRADGTPFEGITPVSYYGGASSAHLSNWDIVEGRNATIWGDVGEAGSRGADKVFDTIRDKAKSIRQVEMVATLGRVFADGADAANLENDTERIACIESAKPYEKTGRRQTPAVAQRVEPSIKPPAGVGLIPTLSDSDLHVALWWVWLFGNERVVVGTEPTEDWSHSRIYNVLPTGVLLERRDELAQDLQRTGEVYRSRMHKSTDGGSFGKDISLLRFTKRFGDAEALRLLRKMLVGAVGELKRRGFSTSIKLEPQERFDMNPRYLGASNGIIDLATGDLLTGPEHADKLVSHQIADPYDPTAQDDRG